MEEYRQNSDSRGESSRVGSQFNQRPHHGNERYNNVTGFHDYGNQGSRGAHYGSHGHRGRGRGRERGRGERPPPDPNRPRPPPHLKGREIGLWHARNSRGGKVKREKRDIADRAVISLDQHENYLSNLIEDVKGNNDVTDEASFSNNGKDDRNSRRERLVADKAAGLTKFSNHQDHELDEKMLSEYFKHDSPDNPAYQKMMNFRKELPSYKMKDEIIEIIQKNQVSLISGETGCGKTTQVAQFILDDYITNKKGSLCYIICTQPRRISAISVAERVAAERNERLGISCGYQIRLEENLPRKSGSILYCTLGVLLRFMIDDPYVIKASHIIIDEIHERDINSDFLLIIIKDLLPLRPDLKIILMSATLNATMFSKYLDDCPQLEIPGKAYNVQDYYLEDFMSHLSYNPMNTRKSRSNHWRGGSDKVDQTEYFEYLESIETKHPPNVISRLRDIDFTQIDHDLIMAVLMHIIKISQDGAILIFLPGWKDISNLYKALTQSAVFSNGHRFLLIPLHSQLPTVSQREVFERPPPGCRKIVIATNIAETSITIDDVVYVINGGKAKEKNYNVELNVASLDANWVSKASEKQRRGRAGRVQDGHCFHLYTKYHHSTFREFQQPEMLRTPLDSLCLQIKILNLGKMWEFLCKAIEPPLFQMCQLAIKELVQMRALDDEENLTSLGYHLAVLPVSPKIGRMILFGAIFSCLDPILTVAASLETKDPFLAPLGKEKEADRRKKYFAAGSKSDHIALINAFKEWKVEKKHGTEGNFCWNNFVSNSHLKFIDGIKHQFKGMLMDIGFVDKKVHGNYHRNNRGNFKDDDDESNKNSHKTNLVKAVICAGLYPNVAKLEYNANGTRVRSIYTVGDPEKSMKVSLHPKSVNCEEKDFETQWLIYHEKMKMMSKIYMFDTTMISPYPLLFFGGSIRYHKEGGQETVEVDHGIKFHSSIRTAELVIELREELDKLLGKKIKNPKMQLVAGDNDDMKILTDEQKILKAIIDLISKERVVTKGFAGQ